MQQRAKRQRRLSCKLTDSVHECDLSFNAADQQQHRQAQSTANKSDDEQLHSHSSGGIRSPRRRTTAAKHSWPFTRADSSSSETSSEDHAADAEEDGAADDAADDAPDDAVDDDAADEDDDAADDLDDRSEEEEGALDG